ncbi:MAG: sulfatase-like hydrolase/transferase [Spirochaetaceae bacterium]|nr:MAG: sulfatase-like hydrolase/transferase [Spirochaetaceae bacterium]
MKKILIPLLFLAGLLLYLLWPFSRHEWDIRFDREMITYKKKYLEQLGGSRLSENRILSTQPWVREQPNILLISADDLGIMDVSLYGGEVIDTPNIDSIGERGVVFSQGFASSSICCPSRAALLTGRDQNRFGFTCHMIDVYLRSRLTYFLAQTFIDTDAMNPVYRTSVPRRAEIRKQGLPPSEITLGEILQSAGYHTAMIGKWHLGYDQMHHPNERGFDYQYGFIEAFSLYAEEDRSDIVNYKHNLFWEKHIWKTGRKGPSAITRNGRQIEEPEYLTDAIARESVDFIRKHVAERGEEPFFLYASFNAPHTPFQATQEYYQRFSHVENPAQRVYRAMVAQLDDAIGEILNILEDLQIADNTLIMFCSDNGGAEYTEGTSNDPYRGGKMTHFDGGLRVPFLMRWDGVIPAGTRVEDPVVQTDLFASAVAAAGLPLPEDRIYDGVDLLSFIVNRQSGTPHERLHWKSIYASIVRQERWKLIANHRQNTIRLYDLEADPGEMRNLAVEQPETVRQLLGEIQLWEEQLPPPLWPNLMEVRWDIDGEEIIFGI